MSIVVNINNGADFEPVSEGVHQGILVDIVDLGAIQTAFGLKEKVQFTWLTDEADEGGRTKRLFKRYTKSLHEKASLRKDVEKLLGRPLPNNLADFDIETLLGQQNSLVIQHSEAKDGSGKIYANLIGLMKPQGGKIPVPADFQRKKDRTDTGYASGNAQRKPNASVSAAINAAGGGRAVAAAAYAPATTPISNDDIPF